MKLADMLNAYAQSTGDKIMHRVGVAEALAQLVETSLASRINAIEQFRDAMIGYVNDSVELMKSADISDKEELLASIRSLIEDMLADRRDILAGEAPSTFIADVALQRPFRERAETSPAAPAATPAASIDLPPFVSNPGATGTQPGPVEASGTSDKDHRGRVAKSAA